MISNNENKTSSFDERFNKVAERNKTNEIESNTEFATRNIGQHAARTTETALGLPGNLKKAFSSMGDFLKEYWPIETNIKKNELEAFGTPEKGGFEDFIMNPPTSSDIRENGTKYLAEKLTGNKEYFEPKSEGEKIAGELNQDITSFFLPGTGQLRLGTRLGAPIVGNLAKQGAIYLGADEKIAEKANQSNPGQFSSNRIAEAKAMIPDTATVNVTNLANRLMPLYNRMQRGLGVPSKSRAIQGMQDLANQVQNNRMSMRSLMDARDHVNEWISEAGGWDVPTNTRDASLRNLNELKTQIIRTVDENMASRFPQAAELYQTGYQAAAVNHQSNAISNFIQKNFGRKAASVGAKLLFPSLVGGATILPKTAATAAIGFPLYKTGQVLYRVGNSPTLANYYYDVITSSLAGNAPAMVNSLQKLDKALAEDEKKESKGKKQTLEEFKSKFKKKD